MFVPVNLRADIGAYEPGISKDIMDCHYNKHYLGYVNKLNDAISKYPEYFKLQISQILTRIDEMPEEIKETVRNNGGGAINHEIFGEILSTEETKIHEGEFQNAIQENFGSGENFKEEFISMGSKVFGSGGVGLVISDDSKRLQIITTPNQDSPYMIRSYPVFGIDVWEHSYYLQYKNVRLDYLKNVGRILDGKQIEKRYTCSKRH